MEWVGTNQLQITPPKKPKKITGTRFAAIMGLNDWNTPFKTWCEITRTYEEPFEETIYTAAGKAIEPKQAEYMKKAYFMTNLVSPSDVYGKDYFKKTYGDFFKDTPIFGGMWDYLLCDAKGEVSTVLEMKTTKRSEDWQNGIPEYYALQAALYAYLLGVDDVIMVVSFLEDKDYENPEAFVPSATNTLVIPFKVSNEYPDFDRYIEKARIWWVECVEKGLSPMYDEKRDGDILKVLRTNTLNPETDIEELLLEADDIKYEIEKLSEPIAPLEKRLKVISDIVKQHAISQFRDGDKKVSVSGKRYQWDISKTSTTKINKDGLIADGLLDKYSITETGYRITTKTIEEE